MVNGQKIKQLMEDRGINECELASEVGIGQSMVSHITRGLREPSIKVLSRIASALGVKVADLLDESDGEEVKP